MLHKTLLKQLTHNLCHFSCEGFNTKPDAVLTDGQTQLFPFRPLAFHGEPFHGARNNERRHTGNSRESHSLLEKVAEHEAS
jgi:hypothetical protein